MKRMKLDDPSQLWEAKDHDRHCSEHFVRGEPSEDPEHPGYVPSLFCFTPMAKTRIDTSRHQRRVQRRLALTPVPVDENRDIAANALLHSNSPKFVEKGTDPGPDPKDARLKELETQVNDLASNYSSLQQEYQRLLEENRTLKQELGEKKFTHTNLKNNEIKTLTGLPSGAVFIWILTLVSLSFKRIGNLSACDQLLLVLMKLKLNLTNADLAIRFNICPTQVSKIFSSCLPKIAKKLKKFIRWPSYGTILKNMPKSFRLKYKKWSYYRLQ